MRPQKREMLDFATRSVILLTKGSAQSAGEKVQMAGSTVAWPLPKLLKFALIRSSIRSLVLESLLWTLQLWENPLLLFSNSNRTSNSWGIFIISIVRSQTSFLKLWRTHSTATLQRKRTKSQLRTPKLWLLLTLLESLPTLQPYWTQQESPASSEPSAIQNVPLSSVAILIQSFPNSKRTTR